MEKVFAPPGAPLERSSRYLCALAVGRRSNRKAHQEYAKNAVLNKLFANFAKDFASWR